MVAASMALLLTKAATWRSITLIDKGFWMTKGGGVRGSRLQHLETI